MGASSDGYLFYRSAVGSDITTTATALASGVTGAGVTVLTVRNSTTSINVQRIRAIPTSVSAAGALIFTETDATGAAVGTLYQNASTGAGGDQASFIDFGPKGYKMAAGKNLFLVRSSATGPGCNLIIEAYGTTSGAVAQGTAN